MNPDGTFLAIIVPKLKGNPEFVNPSAAHYKNILREYPQWSGIGVDKTVDNYVRLVMNCSLPKILILLTLM